MRSCSDVSKALIVASSAFAFFFFLSSRFLGAIAAGNRSAHRSTVLGATLLPYRCALLLWCDAPAYFLNLGILEVRCGPIQCRAIQPIHQTRSSTSLEALTGGASQHESQVSVDQRDCATAAAVVASAGPVLRRLPCFMLRRLPFAALLRVVLLRLGRVPVPGPVPVLRRELPLRLVRDCAARVASTVKDTPPSAIHETPTSAGTDRRRRSRELEDRDDASLPTVTVAAGAVMTARATMLERRRCRTSSSTPPTTSAAAPTVTPAMRVTGSLCDKP